MLRYRKGEATVREYWKPEYAIDESWTLDSAGERFMELLEDSVRLRQASDVPLGAFLSGGLDSSTVVGMRTDLRWRVSGVVNSVLIRHFWMIFFCRIW
jgi:asparagine synthase (glutamine-hydrolysing)